MFPQQVVPLHAPFNQVNFPNPKLNTRLKNLIIQGPPPYQPWFTIKKKKKKKKKLRASVQNSRNFKITPLSHKSIKSFKTQPKYTYTYPPHPKLFCKL